VKVFPLKKGITIPIVQGVK